MILKPVVRAGSNPRRRVLVFGPAALVLLAAGAVFVQARRAAEEGRWVDHAREVLGLSATVRTRLLDAETAQRGFLLTGDSAFLAPYAAAAPEVRSALARMRARASEHQVQAPLVDTLAAAAEAKLGELAATLALAGAGHRDSALVVVRGGQGKQLMDDVRRMLAAIEAAEDRLLDSRRAAQERAEALMTALAVAGVGAAVALGLLINARLERNVVQREAALRELSAANAHMQEQAVLLEQQSAELEQQTEEAQTNAALAQEARAQAEAANRAKSQFLSTMSHELRTPLNAIAGYTDLLQMELRGPLGEAQQADLTRIKRAGQYLLSLINDVLNFARLEAGQVELHLRSVPVHDVMAEMETLVEPQLAAKGLRYDRECSHDDGVGPLVRADPERLRQILSNLISNAVKFTDAGGRIGIACEESDGVAETVQVRVRDTGRGIPADQLARIFEPFVQVDRHLTSTSQQGVGLGLAISHDLAERMGGSLAVESAVGVGTTFTLTLPKGS